MDYLDDMIIRCELELYVRMHPHWNAVMLVAELSARLVLAETGVDMGMF